MERKKVLIFPSGSEGALNIYDALKYNLHFELYGCSGKKNYTDYIYPKEKFCYSDERMYINHPQFVQAFSELLIQLEIDYVIPTFDDVAQKLAELASNFSAKIVTSPYPTTLIAGNKRKMYQAIKNYSFSPQVFNSKAEVKNYPVFVKPAIGCGSKNARIINTRRELDVCEEVEDLVISEYLPGEEITVDCFTNRHGELLFVGARSRERIWNGITFRGSNLSNSEEVSYIAETLNNLFVFRGAWFFQAKRNVDGKLKLLEFSVRQSTNSGFYGKLGVNLSALSLFDAMDMDVKVLCNNFNIQQECRIQTSYHVDIDYENVYIDFDDTLTIQDKVNTNMLKLLYQFFNNGKRIILISRHAGDLFADLKKYKIPKELFDEIIWIRDTTPKYKYIIPDRAIFIDNYFKERDEVKQQYGIPVFDVDAAECLLNS